MKDRILAIGMVVVISVSGLFSLSPLIGGNTPMALAAPGREAPKVIAVEPNEAPNDLDITVVISGEGFEETPTVNLGETELIEVTWVSETELSAVVPWGMDPGVYALTVENPGGETATLADAFTVTQGIGVWASSGPYGGWVESLVLGDKQGDIIYATVANVGLFRSRIGGGNWELIFIEIGNENRPSVDPTNTNRLYISKYPLEKRNLFISEDGGDTWTAMPHPMPGTTLAEFHSFVNPHDGTLYGALFSDLTDRLLGLFRFDKTDQVWIRLEQAGLLDDTTPVSVVAFDPKEPATVYAALLGGLVIKSTNAGQTWFVHSHTPLDYITELLVNHVDGNLWICSHGVFGPGGLYRYDGEDWVSMFTSEYHHTLVRNIILDQDAENIETQHIWITDHHTGLWKSENGGQEWSKLHTDGEAIALNPSNPQTIYSGSPDGVSKTNDGGENWQIINEGLAGIVPNFLGINPVNPAVIYGAAVGIFGSSNGGETWQRLNEGGGPIVVDPDNPQHVVVGRSIADDGWHFDREFPIPMPPGMDEHRHQPIITRMEARSSKDMPSVWLMGVGYYDNLVPYFNYDGGGRIYISKDGEDWRWVDPLLDCPPTGFGFDPVSEDILYATTSGLRGGINCGEKTFLRSEDGGQTWQESVDGLPEWAIGGLIAVEPTPPYRIFSLPFVSMDQGLTWNEVSSPAGGHINQLLFLKGSPSVLYAATGAGLYRTMDGAQTWQLAIGDLGKLEIWSLAGTATEDDRHIVYAATVGGVVEADEFEGQGLQATQDVLINAGVYRLTTVFPPPVFNLYLPLLGK